MDQEEKEYAEFIEAVHQGLSPYAPVAFMLTTDLDLQIDQMIMMTIMILGDLSGNPEKGTDEYERLRTITRKLAYEWHNAVLSASKIGITAGVMVGSEVVKVPGVDLEDKSLISKLSSLTSGVLVASTADYNGQADVRETDSMLTHTTRAVTRVTGATEDRCADAEPEAFERFCRLFDVKWDKIKS